MITAIHNNQEMVYIFHISKDHKTQSLTVNESIIKSTIIPFTPVLLNQKQYR